MEIRAGDMVSEEQKYWRRLQGRTVGGGGGGTESTGADLF